MLSKRITENRRLLTAAPAIKHRMTTRSKPRVFRPVACLRNCPSSAAIFAGKESCRESEVLLFRGRVTSCSYHRVHTTFPQGSLGALNPTTPARLTQLLPQPSRSRVTRSKRSVASLRPRHISKTQLCISLVLTVTITIHLECLQVIPMSKNNVTKNGLVT
jgi:hypothetical protein